jgi:protein-tyrosine phosphatase
MVITPDIYWIRDIEPLKLAIMPRPRAGDWLVDEITGWHNAGIAIVVSLLEDWEVRDLDLLKERGLCESYDITYISYPIPDRGVPKSISETRVFARELVNQLRLGFGIAIHCRAGIGRSSVIAGCILSILGFEPKEAIRVLTRARKVPVPDTQIQEEWLDTFSGGERP